MATPNSECETDNFDLSSLTNRQDIPDFYEYIEECLKIVDKLKKPSLEEIKHLLVDLPFYKENGINFYLYTNRQENSCFRYRRNFSSLCN